MKDLAIITVNYKNYTDTEDFIDSFNRQTKKDYRIYIVDVTPTPEHFPQKDLVTLIHAENKGYACGLTTGLRLATQDGHSRFVFINNDTRVANDFVEKSTISIDTHPASLIGGKIYYEKGYEYHKNRYQKHELGKVFWYAGGIMDWQNAYTLHRGVDEVDRGQYDTFEETQFITGCLMCFDKDLIEKVGTMDEQYFLYYEDADWCVRVKRQGLSLYYDPRIVIYHKNSQSTGGAGSQLHQQYQKKNRLRFGLKYAPLRTKIYLLKNALSRD